MMLMLLLMMFGQGKVEIVGRVLILKVYTIEAAAAELVLTVTEAVEIAAAGDGYLQTVARGKTQRGTHLGRTGSEGVEGVGGGSVE